MAKALARSSKRTQFGKVERESACCRNHGIPAFAGAQRSTRQDELDALQKAREELLNIQTQRLKWPNNFGETLRAAD